MSQESNVTFNPTPSETSEQIRRLRLFICPQQLRVIREASKGEEGVYFLDLIARLDARTQGMPKTYDQDGKKDPTAFLHYFKGAADWYITEKDVGLEQLQAFGWADLGYGGELGYISIVEILKAGVELDCHFKPCLLSTVKKH